MKKDKFTEAFIEALELKTSTYQIGDSFTDGLFVRVNSGGRKAYYFEKKLHDKTVRLNIGMAGRSGMRLVDAQNITIEYAALIARGLDPRGERKRNIAAEDKQRRLQVQQKQEQAKAQTKLLSLWLRYVERKKNEISDVTGRKWSAATLRDHYSLSGTGGVCAARGLNVKPRENAPLATLLALTVGQLDNNAIKQWRTVGNESRPTQTALALRMFKAFLNYIDAHFDDCGFDVRELFKSIKGTRGNAKNQDALQENELSEWMARAMAFDGVGGVFLRFLLLTGARTNTEAAPLKWRDIDIRNKTIKLHCKVNGTRTIPMHPYVEHLIYGLPHESDYVFSSDSPRGYLSPQNTTMYRICERAGIVTELRPRGVSIHGLRRTFTNLARQAGVLEAYACKIKGHAPSGVSDRNYAFITTDELRPHNARIVEHILAAAGVDYEPVAQIGHLKIKHNG